MAAEIKRNETLIKSYETRLDVLKAKQVTDQETLKSLTICQQNLKSGQTIYHTMMKSDNTTSQIPIKSPHAVPKIIINIKEAPQQISEKLLYNFDHPSIEDSTITLQDSESVLSSPAKVTFLDDVIVITNLDSERQGFMVFTIEIVPGDFWAIATQETDQPITFNLGRLSYAERNHYGLSYTCTRVYNGKSCIFTLNPYTPPKTHFMSGL